jgi:hypothetical protein
LLFHSVIERLAILLSSLRRSGCLEYLRGVAKYPCVSIALAYVSEYRTRLTLVLFARAASRVALRISSILIVSPRETLLLQRMSRFELPFCRTLLLRTCGLSNEKRRNFTFRSEDRAASPLLLRKRSVLDTIGDTIISIYRAAFAASWDGRKCTRSYSHPITSLRIRLYSL